MKKLLKRVFALSLCSLFSISALPVNALRDRPLGKAPIVTLFELPDFVTRLCGWFEDNGFPTFPDKDEELSVPQRDALRGSSENDRLIRLRTQWLKQYMDIIYNFVPNLRSFINWRIDKLQKSLGKIGLSEKDTDTLRNHCLKIYDECYYIKVLNDPPSFFKGYTILLFDETSEFEDRKKVDEAFSLIFSLEEEPIFESLPLVAKSYLVSRGIMAI